MSFYNGRWAEKKIKDLFYVKKGKRLTKENQIPGDVPFIGATAFRNGITGYIGQESIHSGNTISITYNGSVGQVFYQREPFWASDDVNVLYPIDFELNERRALFFCTVLRHEAQMWSYARKWNKPLMENTVIKVPLDNNGYVDLCYIDICMDSLNEEIDSIPDYFKNDG